MAKKTEQTKKTDLKPEKAEKKSGVSVDLYDVKGKVIGKIALPSFAFGCEVNSDLMAQAVRVSLVNRRSGTANTKTRGDVRGGGKKPWRQKGTGRARQGSIRSPIWSGGGAAHGPRAHEFDLKLPKKMRRRALFSALTEKTNKGSVRVIEGLEKIEPKTKNMAEVLSKLTLSKNTLLILPGRVENLEKASRNIEGLTMENVLNLDTYDVLKNKNLLFLKESIEVASKEWKTLS